MSELTPELAAEVVAACQAGADEAASALGRSLDGEFSLTVGEAESYNKEAAPENFDGPGLAVLLKFGDVGFAALLPESGGLLPDWYADPDPTGESKLSTLAQELSMLLVPETLFADTFEAVRVEQLGAALAAAEVADEASLVKLQLTSGDSTAQMSLIWPLTSPDTLLPKEAPEEAAPESASTTDATSPSSMQTTPSIDATDYSQLPAYSRSLLKVQVPVHVVLASKKEKIGSVVDLAPGTIIKFDKSCEEMLHLFVGNQVVAEGEAVKIGDKFGFRVTEIEMPDEHFTKVPPKTKSA